MGKVTIMQETSSDRWIRRFAIGLVLMGFAVTSIWADRFTAPVAVFADESHFVDVPVDQLWASSPHADVDSRSFRNWDSRNPQEIPVTCAKCHSTSGYMDYLGADGSEAGVVNAPAPVGTVIDCMACHNDVAATLNSVTFPSGIVMSDLGPDARCMSCHQGRESKVSVDNLIDTAGLADPNQADTASEDLRFLNIHYMGAAATQFGGLTRGGYQYDGKSYGIRFLHAPGVSSCIDCHDPHSLEVRVDTCAECHQGVQNVEDLRDVRMAGSMRDYDGDGDTLKGIYWEIQSLQAMLYDAIQAYARDMGAPIAYSSSHPYFFNDLNDDGVADPNEAVNANRYTAWTPRLLRAAFNYQFVKKDRGAYAHNGKYVIQLLFDSIEDLDPARAATLTRNDAGHFAGSKRSWRNWDASGRVPATCSRCHSASGLPLLLQEGVTAVQPASNRMECSTCHDAMPAFTLHQVDSVQFPSGATLTSGRQGSNLCMSCHQGRTSSVNVNNAITDLDLDTVASALRFINVHYSPAAATLFGTQAKGAYEYPGKTYRGRFTHLSSFSRCTDCHNEHGLDVKTQSCMTAFCHGAANDPRNIRRSQRDFDGDGNVTKGLAHEIDALNAMLLDAIVRYASDVIGEPIVYDPYRHPYFFADTNGNGKADPGEPAYASWTPRLLRTAYNYQFVRKDPGAYVHNGMYAIQVLHDSLEDLAIQVPIDMTRMTRP